MQKPGADSLIPRPLLLILFLFSVLHPLGLAGADGETANPVEKKETRIAPVAAHPIQPVARKEPARKKTDWRKFEWRIADGPVNVKYSRKGLEIKSAGGNYTARVRWRTQVRNSYPFDSDPRKDAQFGAVLRDDLFMRRARFKVDGKAFGKWVTYNYEHDLVDNRVLNLFAIFKAKEWLQFRGGQWKASFNRERYTSSAKQQFVERSIVNRTFTVDRQAGFEVLGHLMPETRGDSWYYAGVYAGTGRGNGWDDDGHPMLVGRYQWNFLGQDMGFSSSDLEYHDSPAASLAIGGVSNRSRYTRFSSSGGSQLDGFEPGAPGQYTVKQAMGEFLLKYRGLSVQNENHWKNVYDNVNGTSIDMRGAYAQAGYFIHNLWKDIPDNVELGYRYGYVDEATGIPGGQRQEHTALVNIFFEGHSNKLSFDVGRVSLARPGQSDLSALRYRVQWDVHF